MLVKVDSYQGLPTVLDTFSATAFRIGLLRMAWLTLCMDGCSYSDGWSRLSVTTLTRPRQLGQLTTFTRTRLPQCGQYWCSAPQDGQRSCLAGSVARQARHDDSGGVAPTVLPHRGQKRASAGSGEPHAEQNTSAPPSFGGGRCRRKDYTARPGSQAVWNLVWNSATSAISHFREALDW